MNHISKYHYISNDLLRIAGADPLPRAGKGRGGGGVAPDVSYPTQTIRTRAVVKLLQTEIKLYDPRPIPYK